MSPSTSLLLKSVTRFGTRITTILFSLNFKEEQLFWISGLDTVLQVSGLSHSSILIRTQNAISIGKMSHQTGNIYERYSLWRLKKKLFWKVKIHFVIWDQLFNAFELLKYRYINIQIPNLLVEACIFHSIANTWHMV